VEKRPPLPVRLAPRRLVSRLTGLLARLRLPGFLLRPMLRAYARRYGADLAEMAQPLASYRSFVDFFTRPLKDGARPQSDDPLVVGAPHDGRVQRTGRVEDGTLLQVKGSTYSLVELLGDGEWASRFEGGSYYVGYLAPGDYHRFHWPFDGRADTVRRLPGDLWPVNERAVASVERLFARNERVVVLGTTASGGAFAYVAVGALNVGSIRLAFHEMRTNRWRRGTVRTWSVDAAGARGHEFGRFELGSTVVLLLARDAGSLDRLEPGVPIRVGQPIGRLLAADRDSEDP
jgi:phosphatidylserine decarboxylase